MRFLLLACISMAVACGGADPPSGPRGDGAASEVAERPPRKLATLAHGQASVAIAVDLTDAFVTTRAGSGGRIVKVSLSGGGVEVLAEIDPAPFAIAIDDEWVYFTVRDTGRVERVRKTGGDVEIVAEAPEGTNGAEAIAVEDAYVYWSAVGGIFRALKEPPGAGASSAELLAEDDQGAAALAVDDGEVFWVARGVAGDPEGALYKVAATGGEKIALGTGPIFEPTWAFSLAVSGRWVFVPDASRGRIYAVDRATGELRLAADGQDSPVAVAADEQRVYWSTGGTTLSRDSTRTLSSAPVAGGPVDDLVVTSHANIFAIASNGAGVYFTDYTSTGSIYAAR